MHRAARRPVRLAIVGGGLSGASVALHLARAPLGESVEAVIFEPRPEIGRGLAYSTYDPAHRVNVPSHRMLVFSDERMAFTDWLLARGEMERDTAMADPNGDLYPARHLFGEFVCERVRGAREAGGALSILHRRERALRIEERADAILVHGEKGEPLEADYLVFLASHAVPSTAWSGGALDAHPGFVADPWSPDALDAIGAHEAVAIVGTGLTMSDMVAGLERRGHQGPIVAVSRHGLLPLGQDGFEPVFDFLEDRTPPASLAAFLSLLAERRRAALAAGHAWQDLANALRRDLPALWQALPPEARRKLARRLRVYWDVHRFRIAPQTGATLARLLARGQLSVGAGHVEGVEAPAGERIALRVSGNSGTRTILADRVINCTGPDTRIAHSGNSALRSLFSGGLARPDLLGIGLDVTPEGFLVRADGRVNPRMLASGPLTRGTFAETVGLPEVTERAAAVAGEIARKINAPGR
ncbi:FAD/NAD(P)-binding protein [Afifella sp. IM 167]|uniref:FAD/NAD(P)-binding protein n=1 Tax=Afifella sp. IM 167 TaxID=2033586 RepID=UPI001CCF2B4F|nr:FAD/NAD(P)-binding protein [Afifella sp. IM 167]